MVNFRKIADTKNLYRSALLKDLTEQDIAILRENNIKTVIDLRTPREYNEEKDDEVEGIKYKRNDRYLIILICSFFEIFFFYLLSFTVQGIKI